MLERRTIYVPLKNGKCIRDNRGRPRMYKIATGLIRELKGHDYDSVLKYVVRDKYSKEQFEKMYGVK